MRDLFESADDTSAFSVSDAPGDAEFSDKLCFAAEEEIGVGEDDVWTTARDRACTWLDAEQVRALRDALTKWLDARCPTASPS
jgi:hypothetical protein